MSCWRLAVREPSSNQHVTSRTETHVPEGAIIDIGEEIYYLHRHTRRNGEPKVSEQVRNPWMNFVTDIATFNRFRIPRSSGPEVPSEFAH